MSLIVVCSGRCNIDPDNIATPMAACLGDLVTLAILAGVGQVLYLAMHSQVWLSPLVVLLMLVVVLPLAYRAVRPHPREFAILTTKWAWLSIVLAMVVSSMAGLVLERFVQTYEGMAVLSPIINGVGGNLGAILASRICTSLHTGRRFVWVRHPSIQSMWSEQISPAMEVMAIVHTRTRVSPSLSPHSHPHPPRTLSLFSPATSTSAPP